MQENIPTKNNNPGDLKDPTTGQFEHYADPQAGFDALKNDLQIKLSGQSTTGITPDSTLQQFASVWAPDSDGNDSTAYAQKLAEKLGVTTDTPISALSGRLDDFANAIADNEGYQGERVAGSMTSASPEQPIPTGGSSASPTGQSTTPKLTQAQIEQNIDSLTKQGAPRAAIQSYLDSLSNSGSPSTSNGAPQQTMKSLLSDIPSAQPSAPSDTQQAVSDLGTGDYGGAAVKGAEAIGSGIISPVVNFGKELAAGIGGNMMAGQVQSQNQATSDSDLAYIKAVEANMKAATARGDIATANRYAGILQKFQATPGTSINDLFPNVNDTTGQVLGNAGLIAGGLTGGSLLESGTGLLGDAISGPSAFDSPIFAKALGADTPESLEAFNNMDYGDQKDTISAALENAKDAGQTQVADVLQKALDEITPLSNKEAGMGSFAENHPIVAKATGMVGRGIKKAAKGTLYSALTLDALKQTGLGTALKNTIEGLL